MACCKRTRLRNAYEIHALTLRRLLMDGRLGVVCGRRIVAYRRRQPVAIWRRGLLLIARIRVVAHRCLLRLLTRRKRRGHRLREAQLLHLYRSDVRRGRHWGGRPVLLRPWRLEPLDVLRDVPGACASKGRVNDNVATMRRGW
jgi:hypothetical protein